MTHVAKIIELVGSSDKGWEDAAQIVAAGGGAAITPVTAFAYDGGV